MNLSALLYLDMDPNDPQAPMGPSDEELQQVNAKSGGRGMAMLSKAYGVAKRIRSHEGNVVASAAWSRYMQDVDAR